MSERTPLPITNQKLFEMAATIVKCQKKAMEMPEAIDKIYWNMLQDEWIDWLEKELFGDEDDAETKQPNEGHS